KLILDHLAVMRHLDPVRRYIEKTLCTFQHIGQMSQDILCCLVGLVGYICKKAESCDVDENPIVKLPHIAGKSLPVHSIVSRRQDVPGNLEAVGKVVGSSRGDIAHRHPLLPGHHPGHHLVDCAVTAAAHHQIIVVC